MPGEPWAGLPPLNRTSRSPGRHVLALPLQLPDR